MAKTTPSRTALKIARFMVLLDAMPHLRDVLPTGAAATVERILLSSQALPARQVEGMRSPATIRFAHLSERLLGQGQLVWFGLRKRWMAEQVEAAIAAGARQLLVLGAGFDPLAAMVAARHPEVLCLELDAPQTAEPKRTGILRAGLARANHQVITADLSRQSLAEALSRSPWNPELRSILVAEGLLMYLKPAEVKGFFNAARALTGTGSRIAFSSVGADEHGNPRLGVLDRPIRFALRLAGEPMHWGIRPADVPAFLGHLGFRALAQPTPDSLRERHLAPLGLPDEPLRPYEHLVLAEDVRVESA
ncbi:class I SAM-dependent methyltransferase [Corallococcus sicarius]|uniref:S-adenosyl-L-methionine-dependent methyltransferase n=1 Tax=Corallococcus sicarius TaxID=2316726 RepID=A0A3A8NQY8_9BACT|nr:SAM-dependent methyltransferase [Corallococcus sicarius]RKH46757.1 SAM-dependent methyltransferase [Corallococcus sicarius]